MLTDLLWLQLAPTASAKIGWKYYLVFVCLTVVHTIYYWFRLPEVCCWISLMCFVVFFVGVFCCASVALFCSSCFVESANVVSLWDRQVALH